MLSLQTACQKELMFQCIVLHGSLTSCLVWFICNLTLSGEAQAFATASGVCEWISLMVSEALDGSFALEDVESILLRRKPIGISDLSLFI